MKKEIFIHASLNEARIAITEDGELAELFIDVPDKERMVGNVYIGKVQKIVQGMNAAFIDIGMKQDGFLHFSDVDSSLEESFATDDDDDDPSTLTADVPDDVVEPSDSDDIKSENDVPLTENAAVALRQKKSAQQLYKDGSPKSLPTFSTKRSGIISIHLQPKQTIIVQVVREAYSTKGVRVTTKVSLPGRNVVLLPFDNFIGVSRKIQSIKERKRLRSLAKSILPEGLGCIIRTAAEHKSEDDLRRDWEYLLEQWNEIEKNVRSADPPALLYRDKSLTSSVIRDLFTADMERLVVDSPRLFREIVDYLSISAPELTEKVALYEAKKNIFEYFKLDKAIASSYARKVMLPSGGSIVLDQAEALFVVDVNSGRATNDHEQEKNAFRSNMEAVKALAQQLRLRDVGGIIIVDFIDMQSEDNRRKILNALKKELLKDRTKTIIYPLTQLGLMQITRQRVRQNITERMSNACPTCSGTGRIQSPSLVTASIEQWLRDFRSKSREFSVELVVSPTLADYLLEGVLSRLSRLMMKHFVRISLQQSPSLKLHEFRFYSHRHDKELTNDFSG